MTFNLLIN